MLHLSKIVWLHVPSIVNLADNLSKKCELIHEWSMKQRPNSLGNIESPPLKWCPTDGVKWWSHSCCVADWEAFLIIACWDIQDHIPSMYNEGIDGWYNMSSSSWPEKGWKSMMQSLNKAISEDLSYFPWQQEPSSSHVRSLALGPIRTCG